MPSEIALPVYITLAVIVTVMILLVLVALRLRGQRKYQPAAAVLSAEENTALAALRAATPNGAVVFARVRATDALVAMPDLWRGRRRRVMEDLVDDYLDFVVCASEDTRPLLVVGLADPRRTRRRQRRRDRWLERLCADAGLPVLTLDSIDSLDGQELRARIDELLEAPTPRPTAPEATTPEATNPQPSPRQPPVTDAAGTADDRRAPAAESAGTTADGRREPVVDVPDDFSDDSPRGEPQR